MLDPGSDSSFLLYLVSAQTVNKMDFLALKISALTKGIDNVQDAS